MNKDAKRTLTFAAVAAISVLLAVIVNFAGQPKPIEGFERLGEQFFPDFSDPTAATSLKLVSYNEESATVTEFNVELKDGLWRLPTFNNYPADAEDRLAQTASSIIGI